MTKKGIVKSKEGHVCKSASVRPSSRYVTGSDPFLEPKEEAEGLSGSLGARLTPAPRSVPVNKPAALLQLHTPLCSALASLLWAGEADFLFPGEAATGTCWQRGAGGAILGSGGA